MHRTHSAPRLPLTLGLALGIFTLAAQAEVIVFKDGYTIHGTKLLKEKGTIMDDKLGPIVADKVNGMTALDDGPRYVLFPTSSLQLADVSDGNRFIDFLSIKNPKDQAFGNRPLPITVRSPVPEPWNTKAWTRTIRFLDGERPNVKHTLEQYVGPITPHYVRVGSKSHRLTMYYLTKEFNAETIRQFLANHPDYSEPAGKPSADKREKLLRFWLQADWLEEADKELGAFQRDLPTETKRYEKLRADVNARRAEQKYLAIERASKSGRYQTMAKALQEFPKEDVPRSVAVNVTKLQAEAETRAARLRTAQKYLEELPRTANAAANTFLADAARVIRSELHADTLGRLEQFLTLTELAAKAQAAGRKPAQSPEELLASAITGWHLGSVAAEAKVGSAYKCWMTRLMAVEYLKEPNPLKREALLKQFVGGPNALAYDDLEKLVSLLPPPEAPATIPPGVNAFQIEPTVQFPVKAEYAIKLPDEYHPGRPYPLLILLPDPATDVNPAAMIDLFGDLPNQHGYIVVAVKWWAQDQARYFYSKEEQMIALKLLRHLRRTYQIDSDRIAVWGNAEGGSMALDLAGSHPDTFSACVPVNPSVLQRLYIPCEYWVNFQNMPVYMIMGDRSGHSVSAIRMISERWMPRGFPTLVVSYKGRGKEWFPEELPYAFDWLSRKVRSDPGRSVGPPAFEGKTSAPGFSAVRQTDTRFHWLSTDQLDSNRILDSLDKDVPPAKFHAKLTEGNSIQVRVSGMRQVTVWFNKGMLDYSKPIKITLANSGKTITKTVTPQVSVLMEDLYERADRQRPYFERVDIRLQ